MLRAGECCLRRVELQERGRLGAPKRAALLGHDRPCLRSSDRRYGSGEEDAAQNGHPEERPRRGRRSHKAETVAKTAPSTRVKRVICRDFSQLSVAPVIRPCYHHAFAGVLPYRGRAFRRSNQLYEQFENATGSGPHLRLTGPAGRSGSSYLRGCRDGEPDPVEARPGPGSAGADSRVGHPAREGDRVVQLRERAARPDRRRPELERASPGGGPEEPQIRSGAHRPAAPRPVRERGPGWRRRDPARRREPR